MTPQQYCLRWKFHHTNLQNMFTQLLDRGCFCDVTIACEGKTLKAHRVVLCACSTYFDSILTNCSVEKEPIIVMRDCKYEDIKSLLDFMYKGEINVEHKNLPSLLKTAEDLRIKGLAEVSWRDEMEEAGDAIITRSRKQFAAAAAIGQSPYDDSAKSSSITPSGSDPHISPAQRHVSANVIAGGPNNPTNFSQSPLHLLQSRLNAPPPDLINRSVHHQYPPYIGGRANQIPPNQPMVRIPSANTSYQQQQSQMQSHHQPHGLPNRNNQLPQPEVTPSLPVKRKRGRPPLDAEFDSYSTPKITHVEGGAAHPPDFANSNIVEAVLDDESQTATNPHSKEHQPTSNFATLDPIRGDDDNDVDPGGPRSSSPGHVRLVDLPALLNNTESPRELRQLNRNRDASGAATTAGPDSEWTEYGMQMECEEDTGGLIPKVERPDTPGEEEEEAIKQMYKKSEAKQQQQRSVSPVSTPANSSDLLTAQELEVWQDVIKMNDYLTTGKRPQFWDERFTMRVMEAIKNKELEMKKGACLLGVSYGTLYGRYRETYGCLKHPFRNTLWTRNEALEISVSNGPMPMQLQHNGVTRQRIKSPPDDWDHFSNSPYHPSVNRQPSTQSSSSSAMASTSPLAKYYEPSPYHIEATHQREAWHEAQTIRSMQINAGGPSHYPPYNVVEPPPSYRFQQPVLRSTSPPLHHHHHPHPHRYESYSSSLQ